MHAMTAIRAYGDEFAGSRVLVTGAGTGIGLATAKMFAEHGAKVALLGRRADVLHAAAKDMPGATDVLVLPADVSHEDDVERAYAQILERFGGLDVLVSNAGIEGPVTPVVDMPTADFRALLEVNVIGSFLVIKHALRSMLPARSGVIVNVSSEAGQRGTAMMAAYTASKHALTGLSKSVALEVAATGVRVNSIHPGGVYTEMARRLEEGFLPGEADTARTAFEGATPLGRYAYPEDVAHAALFLASERAACMTGSQLNVDGGRGASGR
jgi:NAD(P)-dependent dehydrogenase (short-subunit alcohol dehydrogenase family)